MQWTIKIEVTLNLPRVTDKTMLLRYFENTGFVPMTDDMIDAKVTKHDVENAKKVK